MRAFERPYRQCRRAGRVDLRQADAIGIVEAAEGAPGSGFRHLHAGAVKTVPVGEVGQLGAVCNREYGRVKRHGPGIALGDYQGRGRCGQPGKRDRAARHGCGIAMPADGGAVTDLCTGAKIDLGRDVASHCAAGRAGRGSTGHDLLRAVHLDATDRGAAGAAYYNGGSCGGCGA